MNKLFRYVVCYVLFVAGVFPAAGTATADSLMKELDEVIAHREKYLAEKEVRLNNLYTELDTAKDDRSRFYALIHLYSEYCPFNTDSAYSLSLRQEALARQIGDTLLINHARLNKANVFNATGMYHETLCLIDSIDSSSLPDYLRSYYIHLKRTVYGLMADFSVFRDEKERYRSLTASWRDSIMSINAPNTLAYMITKADAFNSAGSPAEAIDVLEGFMKSNNLSQHEIAQCAWTLSESYSMLGDTDRQKEQLIISSIHDLKSSVLEYVSLRQLALLLYEEGDLDRAYRFLSIAMDDAAKCNARQRVVELSASYPKINGIYVEAVKEQKSDLELTAVVITILSVILVVLLLRMRKQVQKISKARKDTEEAYAKLSDLAEQLKESNRELEKANSDIADISALKEVYIGRYMDQCLAYIDKMDSYRKHLGKLAASKRSDDLRDALKSSSMIDEELKIFYGEFDKTFLSLFPTFVDDFNKLLMPGEEIVPRKEKQLNTELRIFALIRLGITDSTQIAKFLRYSLTTIYNYRTKVRNKARGDRNTLEQEVMRIGRS